MCVIIHRQPGVVIPVEKIERACDINPHGFGLVWREDGKFKVERSVEKNDPKIVFDLLSKLKDQEIYLHLRFATRGDVTLDNSHPFMVDNTLGFMHNGTLTHWEPKDKTVSDSKVFFDNMVEPLAKMARKSSGPEFLIKNQTFRQVINDYCAGASVFLIFDALGNSWHVGGGKSFEGWWASNDYSFDDQHWRSSTKTPVNFMNTNTGTPRGGTRWIPTSRVPGLPGLVVTTNRGVARGNVSDFFRLHHVALDKHPQCHSRVIDREDQILAAGFNIQFDAGKEHKDSIMATLLESTEKLDGKRKSFCTQACINSIDDLARLRREDLEDLCTNYPLAAADLVIDLLKERHEAKITKGMEKAA